MTTSPHRPRVAVIILNYNTTKFAIACIESLLKVDYPAVEIVIVDNASTEDPAPLFHRTYPGIAVHQTGKNLGYTGGINAGLEAVLEKDPDYVLVLNPDTEVKSDFLDHLVRAMEENPRAAGACGTIYAHHDPTLVWYAGGRMIPLRGLAVHDLIDRHLDPDTLGAPRKVSFITGCMILFRPSALRKAGTEDERFFMILDDVEFSARLLRHGFDLLYVPRSIVYHKVLGEKESPLKIYYAVRNRLLLIRTSWAGAVRLIASTYFVLVISTKIGYWFFRNKAFCRAASMGLADYFQGNFGMGRGTTAFTYRKDG
jgi:GT2 family glycosyltransferase